MRAPQSLSIFAYSADRGTFIAYFLGAIVPLVALGVVLERYVLFPLVAPSEGVGGLEDHGILALFVCICLLSLGSFLLLRRLVRTSIDRIQALAHYDSLTGLPNRRLFRDRLDRALLRAERENELVATCFLDLDRFKRVNDTLGHTAGDALLGQVAERLVTILRQSDSVAHGDEDPELAVSRLGGDEFTFLLSGLSNPQDGGRVAARVLEALATPFTIDGREVTTAASIGIAVYPLDGTKTDQLLRNADAAMYSAKDHGRNCFKFYSPSMNEETQRKIDLESRLRRALCEDALSLRFQPVRDAVTGETNGAEALLRWEDPELGPVSPEEFVPIAEDAGLILPIGLWVLRTACTQAQAWCDAGYRPIRMAVNVSGHQLREKGFPDRVAGILADTGLSPQYLELELTESTVMQNDELTAETAAELRDLGIGLALDDFGTGYSSLAYLRQFPINRVKVDRSFVANIPTNPDDMAITAAIVAMAHNLLLTVVGEGVETIEQAQSLRDLGCEELQGFLFSPAVSAAEFECFLNPEKDD